MTVSRYVKISWKVKTPLTIIPSETIIVLSYKLQTSADKEILCAVLFS